MRERTSFIEHYRAFEVVETFYRADKYHYSVNLTRVKRNGTWTWSHEARTLRPAAARRKGGASGRRAPGYLIGE